MLLNIYNLHRLPGRQGGVQAELLSCKVSYQRRGEIFCRYSVSLKENQMMTKLH